jgi:hypothetical protein
MKQMKVALPDDLRGRLDAASAKSGRSVAEEIRTRLETSFERDVDADQPTRDVVEAVAAMAAETELEMGSAWHKDASAHFVFVEAILNRLERFRPKGPIEMPADADRPQATVTPAGTKNDAKSLLEQLARYIEFQLHRWGLGYSKSEMRRGLVEGRRIMMAAGFTMTEDEEAKGKPFRKDFDEQETRRKLHQQWKLDQQRKGKKS